MGTGYPGDVLMTVAVLLRSPVMENCQARFWRAVEGAISSLTLIGLRVPRRGLPSPFPFSPFPLFKLIN